jgi:hypothetical protein
MRRGGRRVLKGLAILAIVLILVPLVGVVVMWLWNMLVPALFHGPVLSFWQAVGLLVLCRILFGGLRGHRGGHGHWAGHRMRERWEQMTPEERAALRERMLNRCGRSGAAASDAPG